MSQYFTMHPLNPQPRLVKLACDALLKGELVVYLTDSGYALGCSLESKQALATLRRLRGLDEKHPLTLLCHSISEVSKYCVLSDKAFKILKNFTPGPYTFILPATRVVPRLVQGVKCKVVGIRIPEHPLALALATTMGRPILSSTLWLAGEKYPIYDPQEILQKTKGAVTLILDAGMGNKTPSSIIDLTGDVPQIIRRGLGDTSSFE